MDGDSRYIRASRNTFDEPLRNGQGANIRISSMLDSIMRQVVATNPLLSFLSTQRGNMMDDIQKLLAEQTKEFGIEIIDVRIIRADLPIENSEAIFKRMKTEREKEAQELRSRGKEEATIIKAIADKEAKEIRSNAEKKANMIIGEAEAKAVKIYSDAFSKDSKFFEFYKTMHVYQKALLKQNMIVSTNGEFFKGLKNGSKLNLGL